MNRRESLQALLFAFAGAGSHAARAAAPGDRIEWKDVVLLDGRTLTAAALAGRVVIVEIWASWCPFCGQQNPRLQELYEAQRGRGLQFLTFSIDRDPAVARAYMRKHGYTFPAAMATRQSDKWFGPRRGLPELFVVGGDGKIVLKETNEMFPEDVRALARFAQS